MLNEIKYEECCGKCKYSKFDSYEGCFICRCKDSNYYEDFISYKNSCDCFESKDIRYGHR